LKKVLQGPLEIDMRRANPLVRRGLLKCTTPPEERYFHTIYELTRKGRRLVE